MKSFKFLVVASLALAAFQVSAAASLRGLRTDTFVYNTLASETPATGLRVGEQILAAVNAELNEPKKVDGDQLLMIAQLVAARDLSLASVDAYVLKVVDAIRVAMERLFPGQSVEEALSRVLPLIPDPVAHRRLQAELAPLDFTDVDREASLNGVHAGEQILAEINKITKLPKKISSDELLAVAQAIADGEEDKLQKATAHTKTIFKALKQAIDELFPGESLVDVVSRLLKEIPTRH